MLKNQFFEKKDPKFSYTQKKHVPIKIIFHHLKNFTVHQRKLQILTTEM